MKARRKKKSSVKKIYKTTDGYFNDKPNVKKPRRVAVIEQRKDGAVAVVKIYSKKDKSGKAYIPNFTLDPEEHSSLTEPSIVGSRVYIGTKKDSSYIPIYTSDFQTMDDELTSKELKKVRRGVHNDSAKHRKTYKKKRKMWKRKFK